MVKMATGEAKSGLDRVTQTLVFKLREGVEFDAGGWGKIIDEVKKVEGVVGQYWGRQVETPSLFVWTIDIASLAQKEKYFASDSFGGLLEKFPEAFELKSRTEGEGYLSYTVHWTSELSEVDSAMKAHITEVAFLTVSSDTLSQSELIKEVEKGHKTMQLVKVYGNATGAAVGWTHGPKGQLILHGVFGYHSLDDHLTWREHPKHADAVGLFVELSKKGVKIVPDMKVWGVDGEKGYFHVHFDRN